MVRIAIAGGSGNVALEIIDALVATQKHEILILTRQNIPTNETRQGVTWAKTTYQDLNELKKILQGIHTVLSFIVTHLDPNNTSQKNLIDAAIEAGVKRFAPSEWVGSHFEYMPFYNGKLQIREYLAQLNSKSKILEYSLFQPGLFTNYFTHPHKSAKYFKSFETHVDFENCRVLMISGTEGDRVTLTTVQDLANVVARAIEFEGEWPVVGGIKGTEVSIGELVAMGERVRGKRFTIETFPAEDLPAALAKASWLPVVDHAGTPDAEKLAPQLTASFLLSISAGALNVGDEWNRLLPHYEFMVAEEFLKKVWEGK